MFFIKVIDDVCDNHLQCVQHEKIYEWQNRSCRKCMLEFSCSSSVFVHASVNNWFSPPQAEHVYLDKSAMHRVLIAFGQGIAGVAGSQQRRQRKLGLICKMSLPRAWNFLLREEETCVITCTRQHTSMKANTRTRDRTRAKAEPHTNTTLREEKYPDNAARVQGH